MSLKPLELINVTHYFEGSNEPVFRHIDLSMQPGEFLAILGPSGCGKSTLLRAIAGLLTPHEGSIMLQNQCVAKDGKEWVSAEKRHIGMVFQDYALFPYMNVYDNIAFGLNHQAKGLSKADKKKRVEELLALIHMKELAHRMPSELSGGQQQRVALARALAPKPSLLLLDEPFANVDATLRQSLGQELQSLVKREGVSVLMVTHDRQEAFALADKVAVLDNCEHPAEIAQCDTPEHIYQKPANTCVAELSGPVFLIQAQTDGLTAQTPLGSVRLLNPSKGSRTLVIRPEMCRFSATQDGNATVIARSYQGRNYRILCQTALGEFLAESSDQSPPDIGAKGQLSIDEPCWVLG